MIIRMIMMMSIMTLLWMYRVPPFKHDSYSMIPLLHSPDNGSIEIWWPTQESHMLRNVKSR